MTNKFFYIWLLAVVLLFVSCNRHSHSNGETSTVDSLCIYISNERYSNIERFDSLVTKLGAYTDTDNEIEMIATNAMAYSAMMQMDYNRSIELYNLVLKESECEIEKLVADVGLMTLCYRVSANRLFFDYRSNALARIRRIAEEYELLSPGDKKRFNRAKVEFGIVSVCYFSNLSMYSEIERVLVHLEKDLDNIDDASLRLYARMLLENNEPNLNKRLSSLSVGIGIAERRNLKWLEGNYRLLLAISLRDSNTLSLFNKMNHDKVVALLPEGASLNELPLILAKGAVDDFKAFGDEFMTIEALAVQASCMTWLERYDNALPVLSDAYDRIIGYYRRIYNGVDSVVSESLIKELDSGEGLVTDFENRLYHIPECLLSLCREASCAYAGLGEIEASVVNRDLYLELLRTTRINKQIESRISMVEAKVENLKLLAVIALLLLIALSSFLFFVRRKRLNREKSLYIQRKQLLKVCRLLLSLLPHDINSKEQLFEAVSMLLNEYLGHFAGETQLFVANVVCKSELPNIYSVDIQYTNLSGCDKLTIASELPLDNDKKSLLDMLVPYVAVAIEEGLRLFDISEECAKAEEMKSASAIYLAGHKRENVLKRVSVSIVSSMRPFMDRISNELRVLTGALTVDDKRRKLKYVSELTEKLDDLNVILERWIKTRQGELRLRIETFELTEIFAIIEKNRKMFDMRGITLMVKPTDSIIKADKTLTLFMVNTLVDNAAKFTLQGGCVVLESIEENDFVEIAVTDTGIGMSMNDVERILGTKIYDASQIGLDNELLNHENKGSGFGLMNCKGIIDKYRKTDELFSVCSFDVTSTKNVGSRFSFRLPKGVVRAILLLFSLIPTCVSANDNLFEVLNEYADSVFMCNVNGNHEDAFMVAYNALELLNDYYEKEIGGNDTLALGGGKAAELLWWRKSFYPDSLKEEIYYNILDIRNEVAVASLALKKWGAYRYNNYIYSTLYRYVDEDKGITDRYSEIKQVANSYKATIALSCFLILLLFVYYIITFVRHNIIERTNERLVLDMNRRLLNVVTCKGFSKVEEIARNIVNELYACMGETMRMKRVALLLHTGDSGEDMVVESPVSAKYSRDSIYIERTIECDEIIVSSSGLERIIPLYALNNGERVSVGQLKVVTERPLSEDEAVSLELVSNYLASVVHHSAVRVASGYMALEELEEEAERISHEENRMHVQNMIMDNCLSVIKHETVYYPSRIRELATRALSTVSDSDSVVADMRELMDYYSSMFGILSNCAIRELDSVGVRLRSVEVSVLFENAKLYLEYITRKNGLNVTLAYEKSDAVVSVDVDLVNYLFEQLLSVALWIEKDGSLFLRAVDNDDVVRIELVDNRYVMTSEETSEIFVPTKRNINDAGGVNAMEYLVVREIVRMHEDYTGKHGGRIEARSDVSGITIFFTLPK